VALTGRRVLIGFADAVAAPEVAFSLDAAGVEVHAFARRGRRPSLRRCPAVRLHEITPPDEDAAATAEELGALARSLEPDAVMPLDDAAVWLSVRATLGSAVLVGPDGERAELALDKRVQVHAAEAAGLPVPATSICAAPEDALGVSHEYPVIVKPAFAIAVDDGRLRGGPLAACSDRDELERAAEAWRDRGPFLVQPYLPGVGEGLFGIARDGEVRHWSAHRRVRMMSPRGSGSSACVSIAVDPELRDAAAAMLRAARWDGIFMVELLRDRGGQAWFMELNGRAWGSMALARRLGLEYPAWAVAQALGEPVPEEPGAGGEGVVCRHLGRELVHLLIVMRGKPSGALSMWPSRRRALREVLSFRRSDRWYNLEPGHRAVFVDDALTTVGREVKRALRP
jgi:predicted ATP-grasp superfamily ATP-dependent carboligase